MHVRLQERVYSLGQKNFSKFQRFADLREFDTARFVSEIIPHPLRNRICKDARTESRGRLSPWRNTKQRVATNYHQRGAARSLIYNPCVDFTRVIYAPGISGHTEPVPGPDRWVFAEKLADFDSGFTWPRRRQQIMEASRRGSI